MCGIVGYVGDKSAVGIIVDGLKRLEYRGYDSAGVAVLDGDVLRVRRGAGRPPAPPRPPGAPPPPPPPRPPPPPPPGRPPPPPPRAPARGPRWGGGLWGRSPFF